MTNYEDDGSQTLAVDFSYPELEQLNHRYEFDPIDMACQCQRKVWEWVWQGDCRDKEGFFVRAAIACWIFVPALRDYTLTTMAGRVGKKKQSLGRWIEDFKKTFPELCHIQHIKHD